MGCFYRMVSSKVHVLHPVLAGAADLPHALADGGQCSIQLAVVIAELALDVALVGFADGGQPRAQQGRKRQPRENFASSPTYRVRPIRDFSPGISAASRALRASTADSI